MTEESRCLNNNPRTRRRKTYNFWMVWILEKYDAQVIIVDLSDRKVSYTPFYSSANLTAFSFYSSNGNVSWHSKEDPITFIMAEPEEGLWMRSKISRVDKTRGIISLKAYNGHLAEEIAKAVISELDKRRLNFKE